VRFWGLIEEALSQGAGPWFMAIDETGLRRIEV
jgi:hypothetical protein